MIAVLQELFCGWQWQLPHAFAIENCWLICVLPFEGRTLHSLSAFVKSDDFVRFY